MSTRQRAEEMHGTGSTPGEAHTRPWRAGGSSGGATLIDDLQAHGHVSPIETDICVVGSGAAGLAFAREFLGSRAQVLVLESGGLNLNPEVDALNCGEIIGMANRSLNEGRHRVLGGTTEVWPGGCMPLVPIDFAERRWVPFSGWPITLADLQPYYNRAGALLRVRAEAFAEDVWTAIGREGGPDLRPAALSHCLTLFSPRPHRFLGKALRDTFTRSGNVRILLHATATGLYTDPSGRVVERLECASLSGQRVTVRARNYVLCGGGFENARLLLLSRRVEPRGVGNRHDLVGRFYQDHPTTRAATIHTDRPAILQNAYGVSFRGFPPQPRPYPRIRLSPSLQERQGVLNCYATVAWGIGEKTAEAAVLSLFRAARSFRTPKAIAGEFLEVTRDLPGTARFVARYLAGRASLTPPNSMWLMSGAEQAPNPDSRVTLSDKRDAMGLPRVQLDWRLTELDRRTASAMACAVRDEFQRLGLARAELPGWLQDESNGWRTNMSAPFHPSGTTRMASDPKRGVVDENCRVHGVTNLYVAGSSVFPTSGYANPTFTIVALAIRLADHIKGTCR